jgi:AAHS family 4-hydroxybenzoate transporter-like MFS transporter
MKQAFVLDVRQFIDERRFSRFQLLIVGTCSALVFLDGFDAQAMGFVGPALAAQLHIARTALGQVISLGLMGMMIGALCGGPVADRIGRKPVLVSSSFAFGLCSLLTATSGSLTSLSVFRFLTGLGLGGAMSNAIALTSEYAPKKFRATAITTMFTGFSVGAAVGGFVAGSVISRFGWQAVFVVGGILPLLVGVLSLVFLPESIRFLLIKGKDRRRVTKYLLRIAPDGGPFQEISIGMDEHEAGGSPVIQLFKGGRGITTLLLWIMYFMNLLDLYFLNSWLPTVINDTGIKVSTAIYITTFFQIGGAISAPVFGRIFDRWSSFALLGWIYLTAAVMVFFVGQAGASVGLLAVTVFAAGVCVIGGQTTSNALTAEFYPTGIRSTGVGWALGIGRIGSIIGPTVGGALLAVGGDPKHVFLAAAGPPLVATAAAFGATVAQKRRKCS